MKIGIFFGGPAREREISFSGGKTAMENIDKTLFTPVPVFVDSVGNFIILNDDLVYAGSIRDFYPPKSYQKGGFNVYAESLGELSDSETDTLIAQVGKRIKPEDFKNHFDFAFIAMHGPTCEDGSIQGLLEWYNIPYSGPGLMGSSIGIDKIAQNELLKLSVGLDKKTEVITWEEWNSFGQETLFDQVKNEIGLPFVVKAPHQGSSIGVAFVKTDDFNQFKDAVKQCFFIKEISFNEWSEASREEKHQILQRIANLDEGIGFPLVFQEEIVYHPEDLLQKFEEHFSDDQVRRAVLTSLNSEDAVLFESFVNGQEFSCGVIQKPNLESVALPPTEIVKVVEVFDFNSKYKPGATRKRLPIETSLENLHKVQADVKKAFDSLRFGVCTRIDGFLTESGNVILHDPNTIPGMSPTSLIFKQMAEIGLNVSDAITYFIRQSIRERICSGKNTFRFQQLLEKLDEGIAERIKNFEKREKVAIIFGGFNVDAKEDSFEKARKVFGHIAASKEYAPVPVFVSGNDIENYSLHVLPANLMFKEHAEDIEKALDGYVHPMILETRENALDITLHFTGKPVDILKTVTLEEVQSANNAAWNSVSELSVLLPAFTI